MAKKFPKFSQALAEDPTTRRLWFGIATAHDFEAHDGMTEQILYQKIFASHFGQLAIIFLWTSANLIRFSSIIFFFYVFSTKKFCICLPNFGFQDVSGWLYTLFKRKC